jgi:hypothetical protein
MLHAATFQMSRDVHILHGIHLHHITHVLTPYIGSTELMVTCLCR